MAASQRITMYSQHQHQQPAAASSSSTSQCMDPSEMDSWIDFNAFNSPSTSNMSRKASHISSIASPTSTIIGPVDVSDEHQTPVQPSHDYRRFRQTTGLPANSVAGLRTIAEHSPSGIFADSFDANMDDLSVPVFDGMFGLGSNSGLGAMDGDFSSSSAFADSSSADIQSYLYSMGESSQQTNDFVSSSINPAVVAKQEDDAQANVRFYPGMHQQQAALQKAQQQAEQQRQQQIMIAQQQQQQKLHRLSEDSVYEETITRALAQIRQNSNMYSDDYSGGMSSGNGKAKKDEEDMDEDERLLNSEEGKKLSSKERRQLRNKVSARAFRSRRKEYITQLEAEIAQKVAENADLKHANRALMGENDAFRTLAQVFVSHPAFHSVVADISRSPDLSAALAKMTGSVQLHQQPQSQSGSQSQQQQSQAMPKDVASYMPAQQIPIPSQQDVNQQVNMTLMPENVNIDFSTLNLNNSSYIPMPTFQTPQVFAVTEVVISNAPTFDTEERFNKGESVLDRFERDATEKMEMPTITDNTKSVNALSSEAPFADQQVTNDFDESDENVTLYAVSNSTSTVINTADQARPDLIAKPSTFVLQTITQSQVDSATARLDKLFAKLDRRFARLNALTASFDM